MIVFSAKYHTKLSIENLRLKLKKITSRESKFEDPPVFFIGSINTDNFQIEPDYMDRFRSSVPKIYGTYYSRNNESIVSVKIEYRYGIVKLIACIVWSFFLGHSYTSPNAVNGSFDILEKVGFFVLVFILLDGLLFCISSHRMLSTLKLFIAAKKS